MSRSDISSQQGILLHSCCLTNLVASNYLDEILQTLPPVFFSYDVYKRKPLFFDSYLSSQDRSSLELEKKRITDDMFPQMLSLIQLPMEQLGQAIDFAMTLGGDSEGYTATLALSHHWAVGMDAPMTISWFKRSVPDLPIISTPVFIKHWMDCASPPVQDVAQAIKNISQRTYYVPPHMHLLSSWWKSYLDP